MEASEEKIAGVNEELERKSKAQKEKVDAQLTAMGKRLGTVQKELREEV